MYIHHNDTPNNYTHHNEAKQKENDTQNYQTLSITTNEFVKHYRCKAECCNLMVMLSILAPHDQNMLIF